MRTNNFTGDKRKSKTARTAGGMGAPAAVINAEQQLRRSTLSCLLWEDLAYETGRSVMDTIAKTIPNVDPQTCADIAIECRKEQKLRHVPLYIAREMLKHPEHRKKVADVLVNVCTRPDQLTEMLSIYWKTNKKKALPAQLKKGLGRALNNFDEYQLGKWNRQADVRLRDVLFLSHAKPKPGNEELFKKLAEDTLSTPDTWEVGLSAAKTKEEKAAVWTRLIDQNKLGALAVLRNLRNIIAVLPKSKVRQAINQCNPAMLLPIDFIKAADYAPDYVDELEQLMFKCCEKFPKLKGETIFILDVSGSMWSSISAKSNYSRMEVGFAMTMLAREMSESCSIYLTAGEGWHGEHKTAKVPNLRGFGLHSYMKSNHGLGGGGIFTRQALDYVRSQEKETPDRIIVFSDSQDCDISGKLPSPFGKKNYIIDVSSHTNGINYKGVWDAEISGWSDTFLRYIYEIEKFDSRG